MSNFYSLFFRLKMNTKKFIIAMKKSTKGLLPVTGFLIEDALKIKLFNFVFGLK